jgi:multiple sugar transport system permease protein
VKKSKNKFSLSEAQLGYLMIAPAVIIICALALYPVLRSLYYSLFDLRLNNPTKNETNLSYKIDLERYYNNYDIVAGALKRASTEANEDVKPQLEKAYSDLQTADALVEKEPEVAKRTAQVKAFTSIMQAITDDKIKFAALSKDSAQKLINTFGPLSESLSKMDGGKNAKLISQKLQVSCRN